MLRLRNNGLFSYRCNGLDLFALFAGRMYGPVKVCAARKWARFSVGSSTEGMTTVSVKLNVLSNRLRVMSCGVGEWNSVIKGSSGRL